MKLFNVYCGKVFVETIPAEDQEIAIVSAKWDVENGELVGVDADKSANIIKQVKAQPARGAIWVANQA